MTSQGQLEANRANAKRSTGPRTRSGKARSSMNAVSHGLTAKNIVAGDEDPDEFERLRADLQADFQPSTRLAHEVVEHLAGLLWRQRRVARLEALLVKAYQAESRAEIEDEREVQHCEAVNQEARRRFDESYENDASAISRAIFDETYGAAIGEIREEVEAEWKEAGYKPAGQEDCAEPDGEAAVLRLINDHDVDPLAKITRYETSLMNAITKNVQLLHLLQPKQIATKLINVDRCDLQK